MFCASALSLEYWAKLKLLILLLGKLIFFKSTPFERCALKKIALHSLGPLLVVVGIAGEVIFEGQTFILEYRQETKSRETIASLQREASSDERAEEQLRKDAEDEHMERVKIEASVAWRTLSTADQRAIGAHLRKFPGTTTFSQFEHGDIEASAFTVDIDSALSVAQWTVHPPGEMEQRVFPNSLRFVPHTGPLLPTGVLIHSSEGGIKAANALRDELRSKGFDAEVSPTKSDGKTSVLVIDVNHRPEGPQGQFKLKAEAEAKSRKIDK